LYIKTKNRRLLSLLKREKLSKKFLQRGEALDFTVKEEGGVTPPSPLVFFPPSHFGYGGFCSLLVDPGEFCSPWLCLQWS